MNIMVSSYLVGIIIYFPAVVVAYVQRILWRHASDHVIHMRRLGLSSCATVRDKKRNNKVCRKLITFISK